MGSIIFLAALLGIMYFIMIRPQQRQMKAHAALIRSLEPGMVVVTNSGIHGAIAEVEDKVVWLEVAPEVELKDKLETSGLPFAPVTKPEELFDDPHLNASGGLVPVTLPDGSTAHLPALPLEMGDHRPGVRRDLPGSGEHSAEVLAEIGYDPERIAALSGDGVISEGDFADEPVLRDAPTAG